jgi:hypothetical protein
MEQGGSITVKIVAKVVDHFNELSTLAGLIEEIMKFCVKLDNLIMISFVQGVLRVLQLFLQGGDFIRSDMKGGQVSGITFKSTPNPKDLLHVPFGEFPYGKASLWKSGDQFIPLQLVESFPDRSTTDSNLMGQLFLDETLPGFKFSVEDRLF